MALVNYADSDVSGSDSDDESVHTKRTSKPQNSLKNFPTFNDKVEDEYKMRIPKNAKPFFEPLNIKRKAGLNGKLILTIPTVEEFISSDESDSDEPSVAKKLPPKSGGPKSTQNLLEILPPTRALIIREGDKPVIPSPLIPRQAYRNAPPKPSNSKPPMEAVQMEDDDQDNDGSAAPESFFSFNPAQEAPTDSTAAEELRRKARESILAAEAVAAAAAAVGPSLPQESSSSGTGLPELKKKPFEEWELHRRPRPENEELENEDADEEMEPVFTEETFIPGPERKRARMGRAGAGAASVADILAASGGVNVREVKADDLTAGANLELIKNITAAKPKPDPKQHLVNNPGKLAFRKHQITWLAYKAQEQEYELQEQWAESRRNQLLSRQKYGF